MSERRCVSGDSIHCTVEDGDNNGQCCMSDQKATPASLDAAFSMNQAMPPLWAAQQMSAYPGKLATSAAQMLKIGSQQVSSSLLNLGLELGHLTCQRNIMRRTLFRLRRRAARSNRFRSCINCPGRIYALTACRVSRTVHLKSAAPHPHVSFAPHMTDSGVRICVGVAGMSNARMSGGSFSLLDKV